MLMRKERRPAIRTLRGWAIGLLQEAGAIHECEEHGWAKDRTDPQARERALELAGEDHLTASPPTMLSQKSAPSWIPSVIPARSVCPAIERAPIPPAQSRMSHGAGLSEQAFRSSEACRLDPAYQSAYGVFLTACRLKSGVPSFHHTGPRSPKPRLA